MMNQVRSIMVYLIIFFLSKFRQFKIKKMFLMLRTISDDYIWRLFRMIKPWSCLTEMNTLLQSRAIKQNTI